MSSHSGPASKDTSGAGSREISPAATRCSGKKKSLRPGAELANDDVWERLVRREHARSRTSQKGGGGTTGLLESEPLQPFVSSSSLHDPPKQFSQPRKKKKAPPQQQQLRDVDIMKLIAQRDSQLRNADEARVRASRVHGITTTHAPTDDIRICYSTAKAGNAGSAQQAGPAGPACSSTAAKGGAASARNNEQCMSVNGMQMRFEGDGSLQPAGCSLAAIDSLARNQDGLRRVSISTDSSKKADFRRSASLKGRGTSETSTDPRDRKMWSEPRTFATMSEEAHESLNKSADKVRTELAARKKDGMDERLQSEAEKREANRKREEGVLKARDGYGVTTATRRDLERRSRNLSQLEEQVGRVRGIAAFSGRAGRLIIYNVLIIIIGLAIILDVHIPETQQVGNSSVIVPMQSMTIMQRYSVYAFAVYVTMVVGACAAIVGTLLVYIFANYKRMTFFFCFNTRKDGQASVEYVARIAFTATACTYITATAQIITIYPHISTAIPIANEVYTKHLATVGTLSAASVGSIAFDLTMLAIYYLLPVLVLGSVFETKTLTHSSYPLLFGIRKNAQQRSTNQNVHLLAQALIVNVYAFLYVYDLNFGSYRSVLMIEDTTPLNVSHFHMMMHVALALLINGLNMFQLYLGGKEKAVEADQVSLEERLKNIDNMGRAVIEKNKMARIAIHKNGKLMGRTVRMDMDMEDCPTSSDGMAKVSVTLLDVNKQIVVEEFQLAPDIPPEELTKSKELSELQAADAREKSRELKMATEALTKLSVVLLQWFSIALIALILICSINGPFSSQAIIMFLLKRVEGNSEELNRALIAGSRSWKDNNFPYYSLPEFSSYNISDDELAEARLKVQRFLCPEWIQCIVADKSVAPPETVCGICQILPADIISMPPGYYSQLRPSFIDTEDVEWTMMYFVAGFAGAGAIFGLFFSRCGLGLGGCKNLTVVFICLFAAAFIGMGFSVTSYVFGDPSTLYFDDGSGSPEVVTDTDEICSTPIASTVYKLCMLSTADKYFDKRNDGLQTFVFFGLEINQLIIMIEMIVEKRRVVTGSQGPLAWAIQSAKVFTLFTLVINLPANVFINFFIELIDPKHHLSGVYPYIINNMGAHLDLMREAYPNVYESLLRTVSLKDYRAMTLAMTSITEKDSDFAYGGLFLIFITGTWCVHFMCAWVIYRVSEHSPNMMYAQRLLLVFGYLGPLLYSVRGFYLGLFGPSMFNNTNALLYLVFIGMGFFYLQACCTSKVMPVFDYVPRFWPLQIAYYVAYIMPLFAAISLVLAVSAATIYDEADYHLANFGDSLSRETGSCLELSSDGGNNCAPGWPTVLAYCAVSLGLAWMAAILLIFGKAIPGICGDMQFYMVNDFIPNLWAGLTERYPMCTSLCARCCQQALGDELEEMEASVEGGKAGAGDEVGNGSEAVASDDD